VVSLELEISIQNNKLRDGKGWLPRFIKKAARYFCRYSMQEELLILSWTEACKHGLLQLKESFTTRSLFWKVQITQSLNRWLYRISNLLKNNSNKVSNLLNWPNSMESSYTELMATWLISLLDHTQTIELINMEEVFKKDVDSSSN
jgi:hypothetical protein